MSGGCEERRRVDGGERRPTNSNPGFGSARVDCWLCQVLGSGVIWERGGNAWRCVKMREHAWRCGRYRRKGKLVMLQDGGHVENGRSRNVAQVSQWRVLHFGAHPSATHHEMNRQLRVSRRQEGPNPPYLCPTAPSRPIVPSLVRFIGDPDRPDPGGPIQHQNVLQLQSLGALPTTALFGPSSPLPPPMRCAPAPEIGVVGVVTDPVLSPSPSPSPSPGAARQRRYRSQQCWHARDGLPSG